MSSESLNSTLLIKDLFLPKLQLKPFVESLSSFMPLMSDNNGKKGHLISLTNGGYGLGELRN